MSILNSASQKVMLSQQSSDNNGAKVPPKVLPRRSSSLRFANRPLPSKNKNSIKTRIISKFLSEKVIGEVGSENYLNSKYGLN